MIDFCDFDPSKSLEIKDFQHEHTFRCEAYQSLWKFKWDARNQPISGVKELGKYPWELNVLSSSEDEDNDTDEESDEEGEEFEEEPEEE